MDEDVGTEPEHVPAGSPADLDTLRAEAVRLRRGVRQGHPDDVATLCRHHPDAGRDPAGLRSLSLRDAQFAVARSHGSPSWRALVAEVGTQPVPEGLIDRWAGARLNNEVWDLLDDGLGPDSAPSDRDLALFGAYASLRHWLDAGTAANAARGEHLVSRTATAVGLTAVGLVHANRCLDLVTAEPEAMADWDLPLAHEALARALAAEGDPEGGRRHRTAAVEALDGIADAGDRAMVERELARPPWFGVD
ncbi:MAG: hypothetical protein GXX79_05575 [Actinomycetales bacterium]|nr:hypothetical protein [Actinomycetales bacterium]